MILSLSATLARPVSAAAATTSSTSMHHRLHSHDDFMGADVLRQALCSSAAPALPALPALPAPRASLSSSSPEPKRSPSLMERRRSRKGSVLEGLMVAVPKALVANTEDTRADSWTSESLDHLFQQGAQFGADVALALDPCASPDDVFEAPAQQPQQQQQQPAAPAMA